MERRIETATVEVDEDGLHLIIRGDFIEEANRYLEAPVDDDWMEFVIDVSEATTLRNQLDKLLEI